MKRGVFLLLLLCLPFVTAADLSDYPMFAGPIQVVVGDDAPGIHPIVATDIMFTLKSYDKNDVNFRFASEVANYSSDYILIGGPCVNSLTKKFYPVSSCTLDGSGVYYLSSEGRDIVTLVASSDDLLRDLGELVRYHSSELTGTRYLIPEPDSLVDASLVVAPASSSCIGCLVAGACLAQDQVTSVQGVGYYCSDSELLPQFDSGSCLLSAQCLSGECTAGTCVPLDKKQGFIARFWRWFVDLF